MKNSDKKDPPALYSVDSGRRAEPRGGAPRVVVDA